MSSWPPRCYQRAVAYLTDPDGLLLMFDHVGDPRPGTQVPAGGIHAGEDSEAAVLRELLEESGIADARIVRKLGEAWHIAEVGDVHAGYEEQVHHVFHLRVDAPTPEREWEWQERDGDELTQHRYAFRWVTLDDAADQLWPSQSMWLSPLRISLQRG